VSDAGNGCHRPKTRATRPGRRTTHLESYKLPVKLDLDALKPPTHILPSDLTLEWRAGRLSDVTGDGAEHDHPLQRRRLAAMKRIAGYLVPLQASAP